MKHKILGYIFLVVAIAAVISVIYYMQIANQEPVPLPNHQQSELKSYTNDQYGFEAKYNRSYVLNTEGSQENFFRTKGKTLADLSLPQNIYPGTNFGLAHLTFAVRENTSDSDCAYYMYSANSSIPMKTTATVNGNRAYTAEFDGAAAGTFYQTHLYHFPYNNTCLEVSETIGIGNIGNYPPGAVTEVNPDDVWNRLDAVLNTLKFVK